jgi:CBS domain-containing protein
MQNTPVKDLMEKTVLKVRPDDSIYEVSRMMKGADCGCLPVGTGDSLEGIITDRDIVTRVIATGRDPLQATAREFMSSDVRSCREDDSLSEAAKQMRDHGVSRLVVTDETGRTRGILSFGRIMRNYADSDEMIEVIACATGRKKWTPPENLSAGDTRRIF